MTERAFFNLLLASWAGLAVVVFPLLFFINVPYGRYTRRGWGPALPSRLGWVLMEGPAALAFAACFLLSRHNRTLPALVFLALWEAHYIHRGYVYPLMLRGRTRRVTAAVAAMAFGWNLINGYLNGRWLFEFSGGYAVAWLADPRFIAGLLIFLAGFIINRHADRALFNLRAPGETGYKVPQGGLYRWISCPNYLGEMVEWIGWAVATWSPAGAVFAFWTVANLAPRAQAHHAWYREQFPDYPPDRKALLPGLW